MRWLLENFPLPRANEYVDRGLDFLCRRVRPLAEERTEWERLCREVGYVAKMTGKLEQDMQRGFSSRESIAPFMSVRALACALLLSGPEAVSVPRSELEQAVVWTLQDASAALAYAAGCSHPSNPHEDRLKEAVLREIVPWLLDLERTT